jgi:hypothetical protein
LATFVALHWESKLPGIFTDSFSVLMGRFERRIPIGAATIRIEGLDDMARNPRPLIGPGIGDRSPVSSEYNFLYYVASEISHGSFLRLHGRSAA